MCSLYPKSFRANELQNFNFLIFLFFSPCMWLVHKLAAFSQILHDPGTVVRSKLVQSKGVWNNSLPSKEKAQMCEWWNTLQQWLQCSLCCAKINSYTIRCAFDKTTHYMIRLHLCVVVCVWVNERARAVCVLHNIAFITEAPQTNYSLDGHWFSPNGSNC